MSNYASVADMIKRFGESEMIQLSDRDMTLLAIDETVVNAALADATAEINGYLGRFPLPFDEVPLILNRLCCDIARYRLACASSRLMTDSIDRSYNTGALSLLKNLARGDVTLGIKEDGKQVDSSDIVVAFTNNKNRIFSRDH